MGLTQSRLEAVTALPTARDTLLHHTPTATRSYISAVEAADGEQLEDAVLAAEVTLANWRIPLGGTFVFSAGARTLAGKLVPMVGVAPTGYNLVSGDVTRRHISLDGVSKYIDPNINNNTLAQNNNHIYAYITEPRQGVRVAEASLGAIIGTANVDGVTRININSGVRADGTGFDSQIRSSSSAANQLSAPMLNDGWLSADGIGVSRQGASELEYLQQGVYFTGVASASMAPANTQINIGRVTGSGAYSVFDLGAYSIGPWIDLSELNTRVKAAMFAISAATSPQPAINVVLAGGQSNSVGLNRTDIDDPLVPAWLDGVSTISSFDTWRSETVVTGWSLPGRGRYGNGNNANTYESAVADEPKFGFVEIAAKALSDQLPERLVICKIGQGGTSLYPTGTVNCWNADYSAAKTGGTLALLEFLEYRWRGLESWCTSRGIAINLLGMLWHQGEADSPQPERVAAYEANLIALIAKVREFTDTPDLRFVSGTVPPANTGDYSQTITDAQLALAASDPKIWFRQNTGFGMIDGAHWDAAASNVFGEYCADVILNDL